MFFGTQCRLTREQIWGLKVKSQGHWERKCKKSFFFTNIFCRNWIDLRQTKTKMISRPFYIYRRTHFTSGNSFNCCLIFVCTVGLIIAAGSIACGSGHLAVYLYLFVFQTPMCCPVWTTVVPPPSIWQSSVYILSSPWHSTSVSVCIAASRLALTNRQKDGTSHWSAETTWSQNRQRLVDCL